MSCGEGLKLPEVTERGRLQSHRPLSVAQDEWRQAIEDTGRFLDAWGADDAMERGRVVRGTEQCAVGRAYGN
jgi:hypothetical protein